MSVSANLLAVRQSIHDAEKKSGRRPNSVNLIAVSKRQRLDSIQEAINCGQLDFAENYVQEAIEKITALKGLGIVWHFIGRVQTNKIPLIALHFDWVHSLSDIKHAQRLNDARAPVGSPLNVCVQVNVDNDPDKSGVAIADLRSLLDVIGPLPYLDIQGLMCMTRKDADVAQKRRVYQVLSDLRFRELHRGLDLSVLSMGMSSDYEDAIAEGATMVRVGSAIFGARK